jgi:guanylate kinase
VIVIVSGPGGVGKGTVVARLLELNPDLRLSRSWTTRPRRPGEPVDAYVFVDRATFQKRVTAGGFAEWTEFLGELYGTPNLDGPDSGAPNSGAPNSGAPNSGAVAGPDVVLEIELDGAQQIKRRHPHAVLVLIVAPGPAAQEARLRARGDDEPSVQRRLTVGAAEERLGRQIADYVIVNDNVDRAARELAGIIGDRHSGDHGAPAGGCQAPPS